MTTSGGNNFSGIEYVFLDRDGVLNRSGQGTFVTSWERCEVLPGVEAAVAALNRSGCKVIVVTNQRCVALGICSAEEVEDLHRRLREHLARHGAQLDAVYFCPHDAGQCNCRKPATGMFEQAFGDFPGARPDNSVMVGDSACDIEAGMRIGMRTVFITGDGNMPKPDPVRAAALATATAKSLPDFVRRYLAARPQS